MATKPRSGSESLHRSPQRTKYPCYIRYNLVLCPTQQPFHTKQNNCMLHNTQNKHLRASFHRRLFCVASEHSNYFLYKIVPHGVLKKLITGFGEGLGLDPLEEARPLPDPLGRPLLRPVPLGVRGALEGASRPSVRGSQSPCNPSAEPYSGSGC